ncbi:MAG: putative transposase [Bacillales bacterium]|jgi:transposase InsO family protein|nr:putative transposase [Bacillales bacterium]
MYWQKRFDRMNKDQEIEEQIKNVFEENHGNFGYRRIYAQLRSQGLLVNKKKIRRIQKKLSIKCMKFTRKSRKFSTYKGTVGKVADNLIRRRFKTNIAHQKLTTDTSEFKYYETDSTGKMVIKKAYLDPFLDIYNSEIISYRFSEKLNSKAIMDALNEAIEKTNDCPYRRTIHSDQGWAYQMNGYRKKLKVNKIFHSMSRKGNCLDNSPMENFFSLMKQEMYYGEIYCSFEDLKQAVDEYIYWYNNKRIKEKLGWKSPVGFRQLNERKIA